ncbi:MAG: hypothetical protein IJ104_04125 [Methanobrevibacter sp.]|nr:hypothetical protein [Methanobrevibacter sp.]
MLELIINNFSAISNFAMAISTVGMAYYSKKSIDEMKLTRVEANSAEVVVYFEVDAHRMYLVIENVGSTVAKDVKIKFEPELINSRGRESNTLKKISYLPPNYKIKSFFDMTHSYYSKYKKHPQNKFIISYENIYGEIVEREYESDLNYLKDIHFLNSESETMEMSLYKIRKEITKLRRN